MTDERTDPTERWAAPVADGAETPADTGQAAGSAGLPTDRPEMLIGGAFAGGFLAAMILKRLGRR